MKALARQGIHTLQDAADARPRDIVRHVGRVAWGTILEALYDNGLLE